MNRLFNIFSSDRLVAAADGSIDDTDEQLLTPRPLCKLPDIGVTNPEIQTSPVYIFQQVWAQGERAFNDLCLSNQSVTNGDDGSVLQWLRYEKIRFTFIV